MYERRERERTRQRKRGLNLIIIIEDILNVNWEHMSDKYPTNVSLLFTKLYEIRVF